MPGCCVVAAVLFFGPRVVLFLAWLFSDWYRAFDSAVVALLGFLLLPWTTLAWMFIYFHHGGRLDEGWIVLLVAAMLADAGAYGGTRSRRPTPGPR